MHKNQHAHRVRLTLVIAAGMLTTAILTSARSSAAPAVSPKLNMGRVMPSFTLRDGFGKQQTLSQYRGKKIALFFFCGCPWCTKCAQQWGQFQRGNTLAAPDTVPPPTVVVFTGDSATAHSFALQTGLDLKQTVLLPDVAMRVTTNLYHADTCPRVFIADAQGRLRYTNNHKDDAPRQAPALIIASRALQALRSSAPSAKTTKAAP